jgi:hypothetical protein
LEQPRRTHEAKTYALALTVKGEQPVHEDPQEPPDVQALGEVVNALPWEVDVAFDAKPLSALAACRQISVARLTAGSHMLLLNGTGATVVASVARTLLESAITTLWQTANPDHVAAPLGTLAFERHRLTHAIRERQLSVPTINRFLAPGPFTALRTSFDGPGLPKIEKLLQKNKAAVSGVLGATSAVADVLAMAGHANGTAAWCTVAAGDVDSLGFEATPTYRSLFAQSVGRAATYAIGDGCHTALVEATDHLTKVARQVHRFPSTDPPPEVKRPPSTGLAHPSPVEPELAGPIQDELLARVIEAAQTVYQVALQGPNPYAGDSMEVRLQPALPYLTALGTLEVLHKASVGALPGELACIAARMLLEEGARSNWMYAGEDFATIEARYAALRNDETRARIALRSKLKSHHVPAATVTQLLDPLPAEAMDVDAIRPIPHEHVVTVPPHDQLLGLGLGFPETPWLSLAYNLLSQVTHHTPLGLMHSVAREDDEGNFGMSHEMLGLAIDAGAMGAATLLPPLASIVAMQTGQGPTDKWAKELKSATARLHNVSRLVHFLD